MDIIFRTVNSHSQPGGTLLANISQKIQGYHFPQIRTVNNQIHHPGHTVSKHKPGNMESFSALSTVIASPGRTVSKHKPGNTWISFSTNPHCQQSDSPEAHCLQTYRPGKI